MDNTAKGQAAASDDRFLGESVFRRLASFAAERDPNETKHWMPDSAGNECYQCQEKFTTFRRRHHCRICGLIFCSRCATYEPQAKLAGFTESNVRLCSYCSSTLLKLPKTNLAAAASNQSYPSAKVPVDQPNPSQPHSTIGDTDSDLAEGSAFSADHFSLSKPTNDCFLSNVDADPSDNADEQITTDTDAEKKSTPTTVAQQRNKSNFDLTSLFNEMFRTSQGLQMQKKSGLFKKFECIRGKEITDWLLKHQRATVLSEAKMICQCFLLEKYLEPVVVRSTTFIEFQPDETLYKFGKRGLEQEKPTETSPFRNSSSSSINSNESTALDALQQTMAKSKGILIGADLNYVQYNPQVSVTPQDETASISSKKDGNDFNMPVEGQDQVDEVESLSLTKQSSPSDEINKVYDEYEELLLKQILIQFHVDQEWFPIILDICQTLAKMIGFSAVSNDLTMNNDVRRKVKFKKLPGGSKSETEIIKGCVFSKNVIHRNMPSKIDGPRVLLLKSQIEYQRHDDHRLITLEPVLNQEAHYLRSSVDKIISQFRPDILIVEKTVSRIAQDLLVANGVVLIYNVKETIMQRLAKCLSTSVMKSIDSRLPAQARTPLGYCESFYIKEFQLDDGCSKRLMFFSGCPPEFCCTVLIRGGTLAQLKVVKSVMRLFLLITYSTQLERAFLQDCHAQIIGDYAEQLSSIRQFDLARYIETATNSRDSILDLIEKGLLLSTSPFVRYNPPSILIRTNEQYSASQLLYQSIFNSKYLKYKENGGHPSNHEKSNKYSSGLSWFYNAPYASDVMDVRGKHKFITDASLIPGVHPEAKSNYAHFRASGGRCHYRHRRWYDWLTTHQQQQSRDQPLESIFALYLDLRLHLHIAILYSAYCTVDNKLSICRQPEILEMPAYSIHDTTLGSFLEQHCFSTNDSPCQTCQKPLQDHVRQIVHGEMKLVIRIKHVDKATSNLQKKTLPNEIFMWSYCEHCRKSSTRRSMSAKTRSLSFTKYLELLFHLESFSVCSTRACQHHLFRDHYHYFLSQQFAASFRLFPIKLKEFVLPKPAITLKSRVFEREHYIELTKSLSVSGYSIFSSIVEQLVEFKSCNTFPDNILSKIEQYLNQERLEQQTFRSLMDEIQLKMTAGNGADQRRNLDPDNYLSIDDQIVEGKKFIAKIVSNWNIMMSELNQLIKKHLKQQRETSKKVPIKSLPSADVYESVSVQNDLDTMSNLDAVVPPSPALSAQLSVTPNLIPTTGNDNDEMPSENPTKNTSAFVDEDPARRTGVLRMLTTFLNNTDNESNLLKSPFPEEEHLHLAGKYTVNHRELSSIIAHALSMSEYEKRLSEELALLNNENKTNENSETKTGDTDSENPDDNHQHIELHFCDSSAKFIVTIFYAAKFHLLRQIIFSNQGEDAYLRSLSRCKKWQPRGGKSKSEFWQTLDDCFVLKDLNQSEANSFSSFAPLYINYLSNALKNKSPTCLMKIFGVYRVQYRLTGSGENFRGDVLVLENLFNNEHNAMNNSIPPMIYDLKGSSRNRFAVVDEKQTEAVLLDENFTAQTRENPFFVRLKTKWTLMRALHGDAQFLAKHGIVDYSLLVACYNDENQPVVYAGIIDYMRAYTWDKRLETFVKSMGVGGPSPTVISPEQYRKRFLDRINQYFPVVPDEWYAYEKKYLDMNFLHLQTVSNNSNGSSNLPNQ